MTEFQSCNSIAATMTKKGPDKTNGKMNLPEPEKDIDTNMDGSDKEKDIDLTKLFLRIRMEQQS